MAQGRRGLPRDDEINFANRVSVGPAQILVSRPEEFVTITFNTSSKPRRLRFMETQASKRDSILDYISASGRVNI